MTILKKKGERITKEQQNQYFLLKFISFLYLQFKHVFDAYPPGVRFIHFRHGGKDRKWWAGHYGVKMALPTVQFQIENL